MAALGTTISGVAHELNNPLATILTWSERLTERELEGSTRRGVETILHEAERAARIVRNLLTFARKRHTTRTMVDINQVVRETLSLRAYEPRVTNISVIDALASGIPEEARTKIFDPFFTTKEVGKGTGLGLTVAYAIVEEHGGRMWLVSEPDAGASFYVELPVAGGRLKAITPGELAGAGLASGAAGGTDRDGAGPDLTAMEEPGRPRGSRPTPRVQIVAPAEADSVPRLDSPAVLIVEDEAALASAMAESFSDAGFLVDRAGDGEEALAFLEGGQYDIIISDLKMPRMDGIQLFLALREQHPEMAGRIMFVTGDVIGTDAERFLSDSGCRWLAKPFRLSELLRIAREVMR
jgi:CheY-like chemotaxis protein